MSRLTHFCGFWCIPIEGGGIVECYTDGCFRAFRTDESMGQCSQTRQRWFAGILKRIAQHRGRLMPFVGLEPEQDGGLVGEILVERTDAHAGFLRHTRRGETRSAFSARTRTAASRIVATSAAERAWPGCLRTEILGLRRSVMVFRGMRIGNAMNQSYFCGVRKVKRSNPVTEQRSHHDP
ncbi:hypothetical protein BGC31_11500 [Komagataeibacter xylinus]|nr:hypothetical protein H845_2463 [Komagataeibacter xylinus E25]RFP01876.1 hypothetical protein BGC31_11500 [Komagataeibacter xylinus]RFP06445.1 hypothetical protein BFX83_11790 [Komagataeibacter xylinus]